MPLCACPDQNNFLCISISVINDARILFNVIILHKMIVDIIETQHVRLE